MRIPKHRLLMAGITLLVELQQRISLHVAMYFSMVLRRACCAPFVSWSTSVNTTTTYRSWKKGEEEKGYIYINTGVSNGKRACALCVCVCVCGGPAFEIFLHRFEILTLSCFLQQFLYHNSIVDPCITDREEYWL